MFHVSYYRSKSAQPVEDLESALKRLTPAAIDAKRAALSSEMGPFSVDECITPDSIMSTGSSGYAPWKMLPDKLQVKYQFICPRYSNK